MYVNAVVKGYPSRLLQRTSFSLYKVQCQTEFAPNECLANTSEWSYRMIQAAVIVLSRSQAAEGLRENSGTY